MTDTGRIERQHHPADRRTPSQRSDQSGHQQGLEGHHERARRASPSRRRSRKAIVRGGAGTATRTVGLLGGILTAVDAGIIEINPAHGIKKPKDNVQSSSRQRRSTALGQMLREAAANEKYAMTVDIIRQIAHWLPPLAE